MKNLIISINAIRTQLTKAFARPEKLSQLAAAAAAAEAGCGVVSVIEVRLFSDCTGNFAEVTLKGDHRYSCGMDLCCMVDTDTMEVRGMILTEPEKPLAMVC